MTASLRERVTTSDGVAVCPKCGEVCDDMDAWMGHVSVEHSVYQEFVDRWGGGA